MEGGYEEYIDGKKKSGGVSYVSLFSISSLYAPDESHHLIVRAYEDVH
jgi:hypothetical protein